MNKPDSSDAVNDLKLASQREGSFLQTLKAVAWSFLGIRKGSGYQEDVQKLNPVHVIVAGLLAGILFVLTIVLVVRWIVSSGVAAS